MKFEQMLIYIDRKDTADVNEYLRSGWKIVNVTSVCQNVSAGGPFTERGTYGCYVVIEKEY